MLFLAMSEYLVGPEQRAAALPLHREWAKGAYEAGIMLASGPMDPPTGGVMLFRASDRVAAEEFVAEDPFVTGGIARYTVTGFSPTPFPWRSQVYDTFDPID